MLLKSYKKFHPQVTAQGILPHQILKAYNYPTGVDVSKRKVVILEFGGQLDVPAALAYCSLHGYKWPTITQKFLDGAVAVIDPQGADGEVALDVLVIAGIAQGCHIVVIYAPNSDQGFIDGVKAALEEDPDAISISWGGPEDQWTPSTVQAMDSLFLQCGQKGIAVFCASGDNGSSDGTDHDVTDYPASSQYVIACGGTRLELNADGTRASEVAWQYDPSTSEGSGGGVSRLYPTTPHWQSDFQPTLPPGRRVPDESGNADPATGYPVEVDGMPQQIGGTSAVAPEKAARHLIFNAVRGGHTGNMHTREQLHTSAFYDVVDGTNGGYNCTPGPDCVSGRGVMDGLKFLGDLAQ